MYYVYALWSKEDKKFYIGYTQNIARRLSEHKYKKVYSTARYLNPKLVFFEAFICEEDARRREIYLKSSKGRKSLRLILRKTLAD